MHTAIIWNFKTWKRDTEGFALWIEVVNLHNLLCVENFNFLSQFRLIQPVLINLKLQTRIKDHHCPSGLNTALAAVWNSRWNQGRQIKPFPFDRTHNCHDWSLNLETVMIFLLGFSTTVLLPYCLNQGISAADNPSEWIQRFEYKPIVTNPTPELMQNVNG